jgi:hypothetical protein
MDFSFIAYILISVVLGLTLFTTLNNSGRTWAGIVTLILTILILVFYGMRWFRGTETVFTYTGNWPPIINMCPDYLVYFRRGTQDTCVDLLGINRSDGALMPWNKDMNPQNPPAEDKFYFPFVYRAGMTGAQLKTLCEKAMQFRLTWEGITNGESCTFTSA